MRKLLLISALLLFGIYGYDVSEAQGQSQLQERHIARACSLVASSPNYLKEQKFAEEVFKLEDLSGRDKYVSGARLETLFGMIGLGSYGRADWIRKCEIFLGSEFDRNFAK